MERQTLWEVVPEAAARMVVNGRNPQEPGDDPIILTTQDTLTRRGRSAQELVVGLKQALGRALEGLRRAAPPLAKADVVSDRDMKLGGLPGLDLDPLRARCRCSRPWWTTLLPGLAARTIRNDLQERFGLAIREVVEFYDRQLEAWVKAGIDHLVDYYESQAEPVREQVRRLTADHDEPGAAGEREQLEADLRELERAAMGEEERLAVQTSDGTRGGMPNRIVDKPPGADRLGDGDGVRQEPSRFRLPGCD
jgi:hypothetical protein